MFLLGVLFARWSVNHRYRRISIYLPSAKKGTAELLARRFKGCCYTRGGVAGHRDQLVVVEFNSAISFDLIEQAVTRYRRYLPSEAVRSFQAFYRLAGSVPFRPGCLPG